MFWLKIQNNDVYLKIFKTQWYADIESERATIGSINIIPWAMIKLWIKPLFVCFLSTHWGRDKIAAISQMTFSNVFSSMKMFQFQLKFHWRLLLRIQLTIFFTNDVEVCTHRPFARYVKFRVAHPPERPGTFSSPPRVNDPDMHAVIAS